MMPQAVIAANAPHLHFIEKDSLRRPKSNPSSDVQAETLS
jgi:hypothetical protein